MYLNEFIETEFQNWRPKDLVKIQAPTGSGKITFVLNDLREAAKKK